MIKRTFTYADLDGNQVVEQYYFALTKSELRDLRFKYNREYMGLFDVVQEARESNNQAVGSDPKIQEGMYELVKDVLVMSVGVRSANSRKIEKSDEIRAAFIGSEPYEELLDSFLDDDATFYAFLKSIVPESIGSQMTMDTSSSVVAIEGA